MVTKRSMKKSISREYLHARHCCGGGGIFGVMHHLEARTAQDPFRTVGGARLFGIVAQLALGQDEISQLERRVDLPSFPHKPLVMRVRHLGKSVLDAGIVIPLLQPLLMRTQLQLLYCCFGEFLYPCVALLSRGIDVQTSCADIRVISLLLMVCVCSDIRVISKILPSHCTHKHTHTSARTCARTQKSTHAQAHANLGTDHPMIGIILPIS